MFILISCFSLFIFFIVLGRDGEISYSYLFYSYYDVIRIKKIIQLDQSNAKTLEGHFQNLKQMISFAENLVDCRRHLQLMHLGENFDRQICMKYKATICDNCDNVDNYKEEDVTRQARELATLVKDLSIKGNVTLLHILEVYRGAKIKKIMENDHDTHKYYGSGSKMEKVFIQRILKELVLKNYLTDHVIYTGEYPLVYIKPGSLFAHLGLSDFKMNIAVNGHTSIMKLDTHDKSFSELNLERGSSTDTIGSYSRKVDPSTSAPNSTASVVARLGQVSSFCRRQTESLRVSIL